MTEQENKPGISSWYMPQEEMLEIRRKGKKITIGIPSDFAQVESRVPLTPEAVELLVSYGHEIYLETNAGKASSYSDDEYRNAGAVVLEKRADVFQCDIILRVSPFDEKDIDLLRGNQTLISNMQLSNHCTETVQKLMRKKVTAIAYEYMENEEHCLPVVQLMSQLSGSTSIMVASEYLSNSRDGKGVLLGGVTGISPTELVILGATTAAEFAARAAIGLGAHVKIFDNNIFKLRQLEEQLGHQIFTSVLYPNVLKKALKSADVVLGAMSVNTKPSFRVSKEMVAKMKKGSVIIDLNVSQGGCFETSRCTDLNNPTYKVNDIVHYCVPNISSLVARTASIALSNVLSPIIISVGEIGGIPNYIKSTKGFRKGIYIYNGILTNSDLGDKLNLPSKDIDLLLAIF
ncbi:alanine dehydrogenase [Mangrovibacterium diazotrophicum]|uniref:alanine dehydrogenase n=1 Tax=Mangrovibacterium diazotrophicum TaxID=1261403 RepID=A0A419W8H8_9BACT|nr:alanine dehydrogenase [Mangrovibacterium diazotrophicum]RKD91777.1 alanine dehydrogenase [Mangrovibacterium diazotrophicum]